VVSLRKTSFPQVTTFSTAFRALVDVAAAGRTVRVLLDLVVFGYNPTELTLTVTAPLWRPRRSSPPSFVSRA
jgi:hypothetical protein